MRLFKKPKIGLALGSGAARGLAHIGIIKALKEKKIAINLIAGSSIAAFEFFRGKEAILEGYQAAKEALEVRRVGAKARLKHYTEIMFF